MKRGNNLLIWLISIGLLLFTGFRSLHLIQTTLPPDAQILGFAGLAALDGGLLAWTFYSNGGARGAQRTVALLMICVCFAGVTAATLADTLLISGAGQNQEMVSTVATWVLPIIIAANIAATIACHVLDPEQTLRDAERDVTDTMSAHLAQQLRANAGQVAGDVVPEALAQKRGELASRFRGGFGGPGFSTNGHAKETPVVLNAVAPEPWTIRASSRRRVTPRPVGGAVTSAPPQVAAAPVTQAVGGAVTSDPPQAAAAPVTQAETAGPKARRAVRSHLRSPGTNGGAAAPDGSS